MDAKPSLPRAAKPCLDSISAIREHPARLFAEALVEGDSPTVKRISATRALLACFFALSLTVAVVLAQQPGTSQPAQISPAPAPSQKQLNIAAARAQRKAIVSNNMYLTNS